MSTVPTLQTGLAPLDAALPTLRLLGPSGFVFVHALGLRGPEFFLSEFPPTWQREYESRHYIRADPVLLWAIMRAGDRRWSDLRSPDPMGVMAAARGFGLAYGAIFCRWSGSKKSILSLARADREFTDEEMSLLSATCDRLVQDAELDRGLTPLEVDTLRCLGQGLSHKEIARALGVSVPTVKARLRNARGKLGASSATQALAIAVQRNLV